MNKCVMGVVGLGKLGLPLAATLANAGHTVMAVDLNEDLIDKLNQNIKIIYNLVFVLLIIFYDYNEITTPAWSYLCV